MPLAKPRIGYRMFRVAEFVAQHPGCSKSEVAEEITAGRLTEGHAAVNRAIAAGLIRAEPAPAGRGFALYRTEAPL